ncbi:MAG TPA: hypothetical protein PK692_09305 [Bacteroidales bacterium]|jgi:hypothetical protein|nr:MAG: hypothetical protein BWX63_02379 [Bacteroidetes bacterium ADurb.Bin041]HNV53092.1 hypothetical protein [Tenuifilaceae bacterium]HQO08237.1 hypothetical protein [Bacteroidales bacterium]
MRTRKLLFLILLFSVLLNSCHERKNVEVITLTKGFHLDDLAITKLNLLEFDQSKMSFFDSLINLVANCQSNQSKQVGFVLTANIDSSGSQMISFTCILDLLRFDYSLCNGAFYYKGYQFAVIGNLSSFKKSDSKVQIVHINKEKLISMHLNSNENHICSWDFIKMNDKLICISYNYCGEYWFDEKYYQPEK